MKTTREITPDDVTKEADRNYYLGRKHAMEEIAETTIKPLISALEELLLATSKLRLRVNHHAMVITKFSEWEELTEAMRKGERIVKSIPVTPRARIVARHCHPLTPKLKRTKRK